MDVRKKLEEDIEINEKLKKDENDDFNDDDEDEDNEDFDAEDEEREIKERLEFEKISRKSEQWVEDVIAFSTQYSSQGWSAHQIIGEPKFYPGYGDNANCWCPQNHNTPRESLEFRFKTPVIPYKISIYETNAPGSVVKILVRNVEGTGSRRLLKKKERKGGWIEVWSQENNTPGCSPGIARIFSPKLDMKLIEEKKIVAQEVRIEVMGTGMNEWFEIDAVKLEGYMSRDHDFTLTSFGRDFLKIFREELFADILFKMKDGSSLKAHKTVICARCPYFYTMFTCGMKETHDIQKSKMFEIDIKECDPEIFRRIIEFMYSDNVYFENDQAVDLYLAADKYLMPNLTGYIEEVFEDMINEYNVIDIVKETEKKFCHRLRDMAIAFVVDHFEEFSWTVKFSTLSKQAIIEILQQFSLHGAKNSYVRES